MGDKELRELLESIAGVKSVRVTNKGSFCFFQVRGEKNFEQALAKLKNAEVGGKLLSAQQSTGRRGCTAKQTKISQSLHTLAKQNNITPILEPKQFYLLERALRTLYVGNVPQQSNETEVQTCFEEFGKIEKTMLITADGTMHLGYGFVFFVNHADAERAIDSNKAVLLREQQLSIQASRPSSAIISIAHNAGLVDMDCNATPMLIDLLAAAKTDVASKLGSFSQHEQQCVYVQDPLTGVVSSIMQRNLSQIANEIMTGQLIQVPSPLSTTFASGLQRVAFTPQLPAPQMPVPVPGLTMPHLINSSYSFPHNYGYPVQKHQAHATNAYSCYPPPNPTLMAPQAPTAPQRVMASQACTAPQTLTAPQNNKNCGGKRKREEFEKSYGSSERPFGQLEGNTLNIPVNERKKQKTPAAAPAPPCSPSPQAEEHIKENCAPPQQKSKKSLGVFKSKQEPKRIGSHTFKLSFKKRYTKKQGRRG